MLRLLFLIAAVLLSTGCDDRTSANIYDKSILKSPPRCMKLSVQSSDRDIERYIKTLYSFAENCEYRLEISYKSDIHCNATQNVALKATSNFPTAFLRLELKRGIRLIYSYYRDLNKKPDADDIETAFKRMVDDLKIDSR